MLHCHKNEKYTNTKNSRKRKKPPISNKTDY